MKRVLHIIDHDGLGGAQRIIMAVQAQKEPGWYFAALRSKGKPMLKHLDLCGISKLGYFAFFFKIKQFIRKEKIDIIHSHLFGSLLMALALKITGSRIRIIYHEHGLILVSGGVYKWFVKFIARYGFVVTINQSMASCIPTSRVRVIENTVWLSKSEKTIDLSWLSKEKVIVGFCGRLNRGKGWDIFLDAVSKSVSQGKVEAILAGTGPDEEEVRQRIHFMGLEKGITLLGQIEDVKSFYEAVDILLFPTRHEAGGLVHLEAQAHRTSCIVTDLPGIRDTIKIPGSVLWVPLSGDSANWQSSLNILLDSEDKRTELMNKGQLNARYYRVDEYINQLRVLYSEL